MRRCCLAYDRGGWEAVEELNWTRGRPLNPPLPLHAEQYAVKEETLRSHMHLSLAARAARLASRFNAPFTYDNLRKLYRGHGIRYRPLKRRLGPAQLPSVPEQQIKLEELRLRIGACIARGYDIIQIDESVFSGKGKT